MMRTKVVTVLSALALAAACDGGDSDVPGGPDGGDGVDSYSLSGTVVDFETRATLATPATISTDGLNPAPTVSVTGAEFTISGIPPFSVFHTLSGSPPTYRPTYNRAVTVEDADVSGVTAEVLSEAYLAELQQAFAVTPQAGTGIVVARAVNGIGEPVANIPATAFTLDAAGADGPWFLDADRQAAPQADTTLASGYAVFYDVPPGLVAVVATGGSSTVASPAAPVAQGTVTLIDFVAVDEGPPPPQDVSFAEDVFPIFARRGCEVCHSGNGIGRDYGGLTLDGSTNLVHRELTEEISPNYDVTRVNLLAPAESKLLTLPSAEDPPDAHPNITFTGPGDPDYLILLTWIEEGALED